MGVSPLPVPFINFPFFYPVRLTPLLFLEHVCSILPPKTFMIFFCFFCFCFVVTVLCVVFFVFIPFFMFSSIFSSFFPFFVILYLFFLFFSSFPLLFLFSFFLSGAQNLGPQGFTRQPTGENAHLTPPALQKHHQNPEKTQREK